MKQTLRYQIAESDLETVRCPLCSSDDFTPLIDVAPTEGNIPGTRYIDHAFTVVKCRDCAMIYTNPRPRLEWSVARYNTPYETGVAKNRSTFLHQLNSIASYPGGLQIIRERQPGGRLLDIGSSAGVFIGLAALAGYEAEGNDVDEAAVAISQAIFPGQTRVGDVHSLDLPREHYDVVTLWNVIEHLREPVHTLKCVHELLKPGGVVFLETPNHSLPILRANRSVARALGRPTFLIPYEHIMFFTPRTIGHALKAAGFTATTVYTNGWQSVFRHGNVLEEGRRFTRMGERVKKNAYRVLNGLSGGALNFMPVMQVIATKPPSTESRLNSA